MEVTDLTDAVELIVLGDEELHPVENDDLGPCWLED